MTMPATAAETLLVDDSSPARTLSLSEIPVGAAVEQTVQFDEEMWSRFDGLAGDSAVLHRQTRAAQAMGYDRPVLQGLAVTTRFSRLLGMYLPGERAVLHTIDFQFRRPVFVPSTLRYRAEVKRVLRPVKAIQLALYVYDGDAATPCVTGSCQCVLR